MKELFTLLLAIVCYCSGVSAQTNIRLKPCKVKVNNQLFITPPELKLYKGMEYTITLFGESMDKLFLLPATRKEGEMVVTDLSNFTVDRIEKKSLTPDPCNSYTKDKVSVQAKAKNLKDMYLRYADGTGQEFYITSDGTLGFGHVKKYFSLEITEILDNPVITNVTVFKNGQAVTSLEAGTEYTIRIKGNYLSNLELLTYPNLLLKNVTLTDAEINGLVTFEYSQQTDIDKIRYRKTPYYGLPQLCEDKASIQPLTVLPRPTVFDPNNLDWTWGPYFGDKGTFFADVTGEGKADAIVVNNSNIVVRRSNGNQFTDNESWTSNAYYGEKGTFFADVTSDGRADAIVVNNANFVVRPSIGNSFGEQQIWTTGAFFGERSTDFSDVDGDGKADVIAVNNFGVVIKKSVGNRFGPNETFTTNPYYGTRGTFFVDVTGDKKADAIVINDDKITVRRSTGTAFSPNEDGTNQAFYGQRGTAFADIYGLGKAAVIVVNNDAVYARRPK